MWGMFRAQVHLEAAGETDGLGLRTTSRPWRISHGSEERGTIRSCVTVKANCVDAVHPCKVALMVLLSLSS